MKKYAFIFILSVLSFLAKAQNNTVCFGLANTPTLTGNPNGITSGDFNRDGKMDMATCNGVSNKIFVLLGDGLGNFTNSTNYPTGTNPYAVIAADFNNDTILDLITNNHDSNNITVLLGSGSGTFTSSLTYTTLAGPTAVTYSDFNKDGNLDLALSFDGGGNKISILYGTGSGTFGTPVNLNIGVNSTLLISTDLNNDGYDDVATVNGPSNTVTVKLGSATGFDTLFVNYTVGTYPASLDFADFNNDGKKDLAVVNANSSNISILLGIGNGTFPNPINYATGSSLSSIVTKDLNGDGFVDIAAANYSSNLVSILLGNGAGNFGTLNNFSTGSGPTTLTFADFNNDTKIDLGSSNYSANNASVLLNSSFALTVGTVNTTICSGNTATLTVSGALSYTWSSGAIGSSNIVTPISSSTYTVVGVNANGCLNTKTLSVTVNATPNLTVNKSANTICSGNLAVLTAAGANSYFWSIGDTLNKINVRPTSNTNYTLTGTNPGGCSSQTVVSIIVNPSKTLSGTVTSTLGSTAGNLILYKYKTLLSKWDSVAFTPYTSTYSFGAIDSALYVIKAVSSATNELVTYAPNSISWMDADVIAHSCAVNSTQSISIVPLANIGTGSGSFSGVIYRGNGFGKRVSNPKGIYSPGQPIGGIVVKGGRNPGGQMFVQATTAADGTYTLQGIPLNGTNDEYFILVDVPGLDTNGTYHRKLTIGNNQLSGLDFTIDSIAVNPQTYSPISVSELSIIDNQIKVFPNPATNKVTIQYNLLAISNVKIELVDILGKSIKTILPLTEQNNTEHTFSIPLTDITAGMYFMKIKINNSESTVKLFISN